MKKAYIFSETPTFQKLDSSSLEKILALEQVAMNTATTFPLSRKELTEAFDRGDLLYGLLDREILCAKVGFTHEGDNSYELDVMTHPDYQGKGLGKKILELSIQDLRTQFPTADITLKVHPHNLKAINLYTSEHFVESGRIDTPHGPRVVMKLMQQQDG